MALTRKHFNAMADIFSKRMEFHERAQLSMRFKVDIDNAIDTQYEICTLAFDLGTYFQEINPNFDTKRWVEAIDCRGWLTGFHD
jgi:hypothetical protein